MKNIIVTGAAGFIGTNLIAKLLETKEYRIIGIDNFDPYYNISIKNKNVQTNMRWTLFDCINTDISDSYNVDRVLKYAKAEFKGEPIDAVIHLAAQAGVGYSTLNPLSVIDNNIKGFDIMLRMSHDYGTKKFIYASSSTVLGDHNGIYEQKSIYGVTKATNELQGRMYAKMYDDMKIVGLRLYSVYGEKMRPDLAIKKFTEAMLNDEEIHVNGDGSIMRDFTHVDDVVDAFKLFIDNEIKDSGQVYNVGRGEPISINDLINLMKKIYDKEDYNKVVYDEGKPYDAVLTNAWNLDLINNYGFEYKVSLEEGLRRYWDWMKRDGEGYYKGWC